MCIKRSNRGHRSCSSSDLLFGVSKRRASPNTRVEKNHNASPASEVKVKVSQVKAFNAGRLENVLIPMLITAGMMRKRSETVIGNVDGIPIVIKDEQQQQQQQHHDGGVLSKAESGFIKTLVHALNCK